MVFQLSPFVTSSVSATSEHKGGALINSVTGANLCTISPTVRFVISSDSSHHSNASEAEVDSIIRSDVPPLVTTKAVITTSVVHVPPVPRVADKVIPKVKQFIFHESSSADTIKPDDAGPSHEVFISHWNVSNDALLDDLDTSREFIDHLAPPVLFAQIRDMDYKQLFTEFNVVTARQVCLNAEVRMQSEYCLSERRRLKSECGRQADLLKSRDEEIENLKA
ncbi:hypothetical protein Tco_1324631 [Tanacetum coccineum]